MSITATAAISFTRSGTATTATTTLTYSAVQEISESIANSTTDGLVNWTCDYSTLRFLLIKSDQAITIETNSGSTPDDTFSIAANIPFAWYYNSGITCPITADITAAYVTNASGSAANLTIISMTDATP